MALGGKRPGSGRPPGAKNKLTRQIERAGKQAAIVAQAVPDAFEGDAHALLMMVYKDRNHPIELRVDAAGKAIKFEKPALASIDMNSLNEHTVNVVSRQPLTADEWAAEHATAH